MALQGMVESLQVITPPDFAGVTVKNMAEYFSAGATYRNFFELAALAPSTRIKGN